MLITTGSLASTLGQYNPFRYRGYYYDYETGWYYLQSRYYDPTVARFLNADGIVGANGGIQGYNLFAYCNNNPVMGYDPYGKWTFTISFNIDLTFIFGFSISSDISFDSNGDFMLAVTKTEYDEDSMDMSFGVFSAGVSLGLQITSHEAVDDLLGESFSLGGSVGTGPTAGVDLITDPDRESIENDEVKGVKFSIGFGYGFDVHIKRTTTKKVEW